MLPQVSITVDVADLSAATVFYTQALGCELKKKNSDDWTVLSVGTLDINLLEKAAGTVAAADQKRSYERHWTPIHFDFGVNDVAATAALVQTHGGSIEGEASADFAACVDPFGNGFCLVGI